MKVEIEPQFAKNLLAYLAEKPIKEAMGAYQVLTVAVQEHEQQLAKADEEVKSMAAAERRSALHEMAKRSGIAGAPEEEDAA